jgi:hypothetical protein
MDNFGAGVDARLSTMRDFSAAAAVTTYLSLAQAREANAYGSLADNWRMNQNHEEHFAAL